MKKFLIGFIVGALVSISATAFAASIPSIKKAVFTDAVSIEVDGKKQNVEVVSVIKEGEADARNFVSVADMANILGADVKWNGEKQTVEISSKATPHTATVVSSDSVEEWIPIMELYSKYGLTVVAGGSDKGTVITIYEDKERKKELLKVVVDDNKTEVKVKIEDDRTFISKTDLIRKGILSE